MNNVRQDNNQYGIYSEMIQKLHNKCNISNFAGIIGEKFDKKRHYILEDDIHVYVSENGRFIDVSNGNPYYNPEGKDNVVILLSKDNNLDECSFYILGELGDVTEGICIKYSKDFRYDYEMEEDIRDMWFLPSNVDPCTSGIKYEYGELTDDVRTLLDEAIKRSENSKTINVYKQGLEFYDKIVNIVNKEQKITPTTALQNSLKRTSGDKTNEVATAEQEELHYGETKKEK